MRQSKSCCCSPVLVLVDGHDDEVLGKDVHVLGPTLDARVTLLGVAQRLVFNGVTLTRPETVQRKKVKKGLSSF